MGAVTERGYSTAQAARIIGVGKHTLLWWVYKKLLPEPKWAKVAGASWRVWSKRDIRRALKVKTTIRRGRPPKGKK